MKKILLLSCLVLVGCIDKVLVKNAQIRTHDTTISCIYEKAGDCLDEYIQTSQKDNYNLMIIEIDDQGHFYDRKQINNVIQRITSLGKKQEILMFAHGWHHNALPNDRNLMGFRQLLKGMSENAKKPTTGVFIAWRGESLLIKHLKMLTFWDRKSVSHEVGQGALLEFLVRVEDLAKQNQSQLITIGHSLGATVIYSSIKGLLLERIALQKNPHRSVGYGDLVLLLNPAFEAIQYAPFREIVEEKERQKTLIFKAEQQPRMVIVTSDKDPVTKNIFPMSRLFATVLEDQNSFTRLDRHGKPQQYSQFWMDKNTIGHFPPYQTHKLTASNILTIEQAKTCNDTDKGWLQLAVNNKKFQQPASAGEGWHYSFDKNTGGVITIEHLRKSSAYNPYWNVITDGKIIPSHSQVLQGNFLCFLGKIIHKI